MIRKEEKYEAYCVLSTQYYPIPENNEWWERALLSGQMWQKLNLYIVDIINHIPADLGFL